MSRFTRISVMLCGCWLLTGTAGAQLPQTVLFAVSPQGGQAGSEFDLTITAGSDLEDLEQLAFTHPGISARRKMIEQNGELVPSPDRFTVRIAPEVPAGVYEIRCGGLWGFSNPRRFVVGHHPELREQTDNSHPQRAAAVELNTVVNGCLESSQDVDWYRFFGRRGERVIIDCWGERIDSRIRAVMSLYDASGTRRLATVRNAQGEDPLLVFDVPEDRDYLLQLHDSTFHSGPEYGYRLEIHNGPHIELIDPPVGTAGTVSTFSLLGYNLPGGEQTGLTLRGKPLDRLNVQIEVPEEMDTLRSEHRVSPLALGTDAFYYRFRNGEQLSNPVRIGITALPVRRELEPNDAAERAQRIVFPLEVCGSFEQPGDVDIFRFEARAGDLLVMEVFSERIGSRADPVMMLQQVRRNADGTESLKNLATVDDNPASLSMNLFETNTDDPQLRRDFTETGTYQLVLKDRYRESRGDPGLIYRLAVRPVTPDFRMVSRPVSPAPGQVWPAGLRREDTLALALYAFRLDGFDGPIRVRARSLPEGLSCPEVVIPGKESLGQIVISSTRDVPPGLYPVELVASAVVSDAATLRAIAKSGKDLEDSTRRGDELRTEIDLRQPAIDELAQRHETAVLSARQPLADELQRELTRLRNEQQARRDELALWNQQRISLELKRQQALEQQEQSARDIVRRVRPATIVWSHHDVQPAIGRLTDGLWVSVMAEEAPFQLLSGVHQFEVCQGRELRIPVSILRDESGVVPVTVSARSDALGNKLEVTSEPADEGAAEQTLRLFVGDQIPAGVYTLDVQGQSQVDYRRNPQKVARVQQRYDRAREQADASRKVMEAATVKKTAAAAALNTAYQKLQQTQNLAVQRQQEFDALRPQLTGIEQEAESLAGQLEELESRLQLTDQQRLAAQGLVTSGADAISGVERELVLVRQTQRPEESGNAPDVEGDLQQQQQIDLLQNRLVEMRVTQEQLVLALKRATDRALADLSARDEARRQRDAAQARLKSHQSVLTKGEQALQAAQLDLKNAQTELAQAENGFAQSEMVEKTAEEVFKSLDTSRGRLEEELKRTEQAAAPRQVSFNPQSTPVVLTVREAPIKLSVKLPEGSEVVGGASLPVEVTILRQHGFSGPVMLQTVCSGDSGPSVLRRPRQDVPAQDSSARLQLTAAEGATPQDLRLVIRATMEFGGESVVDAPLSINIRTAETSPTP